MLYFRDYLQPVKQQGPQVRAGKLSEIYLNTRVFRSILDNFRALTWGYILWVEYILTFAFSDSFRYPIEIKTIKKGLMYEISYLRPLFRIVFIVQCGKLCFLKHDAKIFINLFLDFVLGRNKINQTLCAFFCWNWNNRYHVEILPSTPLA